MIEGPDGDQEVLSVSDGAYTVEIQNVCGNISAELPPRIDRGYHLSATPPTFYLPLVHQIPRSFPSTR